MPNVFLSASVPRTHDRKVRLALGEKPELGRGALFWSPPSSGAGKSGAVGRGSLTSNSEQCMLPSAPCLLFLLMLSLIWPPFFLFDDPLSLLDTLSEVLEERPSLVTAVCTLDSGSQKAPSSVLAPPLPGPPWKSSAASSLPTPLSSHFLTPTGGGGGGYNRPPFCY